MVRKFGLGLENLE